MVMDGRDIGTVVLPHAELKFFMTADPEVRAWRRLRELQENGKAVTFDEVLENVLERDRIDSERAVAPLKQADDAVVIDNSNLTMEEQYQFMLNLQKREWNNKDVISDFPKTSYATRFFNSIN